MCSRQLFRPSRTSGNALVDVDWHSVSGTGHYQVVVDSQEQGAVKNIARQVVLATRANRWTLVQSAGPGDADPLPGVSRQRTDELRCLHHRGLL